jgi:hypothetical protein
MTQAAEQCRVYIEATYADTPIGRFACRDTAGGSVSQHSAYNGYDSNALDIFAPQELGRDDKKAWIQTIVDDLTENFEAWSARIILWQVSDHYGHAHIDFWPTILEHKWCGRDIVPEWKYSNGNTILSIDPDPENGEYHGKEEEVDMTWADIVDDATWTKAYEDGFIQGDAAVMPGYYFADGPATEAEKKNGYNHIMREQMERT